ncbi:uncharacterized protein RAG0_15462 [Rhynchosporium agropyri]|uniref:Zn(2)-C6 fungal-type domain-containing protein n=1 Tax=Rhynchosporium agropyri TaxID=914238 RepID=A0A1E1LLB2_9HELO|nr:uncharacterized protein RAG0_15462 [Rhynchosporium agropyri]
MTTASPAVVATEQQNSDSVYKHYHGFPAPKGTTSSTIVPSLKEPASPTDSGPINEDSHVREPYWGPETDYIFEVHPLRLPKLSPVDSESNARVLAKMMRQKLLFEIRKFTGLEPRKRIIGSAYLDPLQPDLTEPHFYEWRFTPEYPGFPLRPLAKWREEETRACHVALKNGDVYLVDPRNPGPRPPREQGAVPEIGQKIPGSEAHNRQRLVAIAEAAFSKRIVTKTGITLFDYSLVLDGDGSQGLPGWRWKFPKSGIMSKFPELKNFWNWTTEEILHALHALLQNTLTLERLNHSQAHDAGFRVLPQAASTAPRPHNTYGLMSNESSRLYHNPIKPPYNPIKPRLPQTCNALLVNQNIHPIDSKLQINKPSSAGYYQNPINLETPNQARSEDRFMAHTNAAVAPRHPRHMDITLTPNSYTLDNLVTQLSDQSQLWKQDWKDLQASKARERSFAKANDEQATRIGVLEKALSEIERSGIALNGEQTSAQATVPNGACVITGMEGFYKREISELKAQNEELKEVIQGQEEDFKNAIWLRDRNKELEAQLVEKNKEATSAYEALAVLSSSSALSRAAGLSTSGLESSQVKCDRCVRENQFCVNPGGPCGSCRGINKVCTFETSTGIGDVLEKARKATESASQFLQRREYKSPYLMAKERATGRGDEEQSQVQGISMLGRQEQQVQRASDSPQNFLKVVRPQSISSSTSDSERGTPQPAPTVDETLKRPADENLASVNKRLAMVYGVQSQHICDSPMNGTWETTVAELDEQFGF